MHLGFVFGFLPMKGPGKSPKHLLYTPSATRRLSLNACLYIRKVICVQLIIKFVSLLSHLLEWRLKNMVRELMLLNESHVVICDFIGGILFSSCLEDIERQDTQMIRTKRVQSTNSST